MGNIKAVIFDKDGVLVDTELVFHYESHKSALSSRGIQLSLADYVRYGMLKNPVSFYKHFLHGLLEEEYKELVYKKEKFYAELRENGVKPIIGVNDLLQRIKGCYELAVVSNAPPESIGEDLASAGIDRAIFSLTMSGEKWRDDEPVPDVYLTTAAVLGLKPKQCLVIEDAEYGVIAAKKARMKCIAMADQRILNKFPGYKKILHKAGADKIVTNLSHITKELIDCF